MTQIRSPSPGFQACADCTSSLLEGEERGPGEGPKRKEEARRNASGANGGPLFLEGLGHGAAKALLHVVRVEPEEESIEIEGMEEIEVPKLGQEGDAEDRDSGESLE